MQFLAYVSLNRSSNCFQVQSLNALHLLSMPKNVNGADVTLECLGSSLSPQIACLLWSR